MKSYPRICVKKPYFASWYDIESKSDCLSTILTIDLDLVSKLFEPCKTATSYLGRDDFGIWTLWSNIKTISLLLDSGRCVSTSCQTTLHIQEKVPVLICQLSKPFLHVSQSLVDNSGCLVHTKCQLIDFVLKKSKPKFCSVVWAYPGLKLQAWLCASANGQFEAVWWMGWVAAEIRLRILVLSWPIYDHVSVKHFTLIPLCEPTEISIQGGCFHNPFLKSCYT